MSFSCDERTVMSGDLLLIESAFSWRVFLVDGRINNAQFLQPYFTRNYDVKYGREGDVATFELLEERLDYF